MRADYYSSRPAFPPRLSRVHWGDHARGVDGGRTCGALDPGRAVVGVIRAAAQPMARLPAPSWNMSLTRGSASQRNASPSRSSRFRDLCQRWPLLAAPGDAGGGARARWRRARLRGRRRHSAGSLRARRRRRGGYSNRGSFCCTSPARVQGGRSQACTSSRVMSRATPSPDVGLLVSCFFYQSVCYTAITQTVFSGNVYYDWVMPVRHLICAAVAFACAPALSLFRRVPLAAGGRRRRRRWRAHRDMLAPAAHRVVAAGWCSRAGRGS